MNARLLATIIAFWPSVFSVEAQSPAADRQKQKTPRSGSMDETAQQSSDASVKKPRQTWKKTKAYSTDDATIYREAVTKRLSEIGAEIARMKEQSNGISDRGYYTTRLNALEQHQQYADRQLAELPADNVKKGKDSLRSRLDLIIERLEAHLDLAREEGKDFVLPEE